MRSATLSIIALVATAGTVQAQGSWSGAVGSGAITAPKYMGADEQRTLPIPYVQLQYKGRVNIGMLPGGTGAGIGVSLINSQSVAWQAQLSGTGGRREKWGDALAGMGNQDVATTAGTSISLSHGWMQAGADVALGLNAKAGTSGTVRAAAQKQLASRWIGSLSAGATFADRQNMTYDFGITDEQAARRQALIARGDARLRSTDGQAFRPDAGLKQMQTSASVSYVITPRSRLVTFVQASQLSDEAARSSVVRDRTGTSGGVVVVYGF